MKILNTSWLALAALAIAGCNGGGDNGGAAGQAETPKTDGIKAGVVFDSGGRGDKSFNDSAWAGIERAQKELGVNARSVDSKSEKDYEGNLAALAEEGCKVVFAVGFAQKSALQNVAPKFPEVKFALIDDVLEAPNVRSIVFAEEQGSFLAGYLAALTSKTGKIGFVGGKTTPLIKKFEAGYIAGAKSAKPDITVLPPKYTESWDDTTLGKQFAANLFANGADIVYHAAGRCGIGVIAAAKDAGKYAIGVDSDQDGEAPGFVLTSMVKRVDNAVFDTIKDVKEGTFAGGTKVYDLQAKGVGLSEMKYTKDKIPAEVLSKIEEVAVKIAGGEIEVPKTDEELKTYLGSVK